MTASDDILNKLVVSDEGHIGIVRFAGCVKELPDPTEIWYGVEWKDPSRGKHDGLFKGTRYFQTKHPTGGSFIRPSRVSYGIDLLQAAMDKYMNQDAAGYVDDPNVDPKDRDEFRFNNFVTSKTLKLTGVNLAYARISSATSLSQFDELFPFMRELDLEGNMLHSWQQIFDILDKIDEITFLNVSNNLLIIPTKNRTPTKVYPRITHLIMNRMNYTWNEILEVLDYFPSLVELKVCFNQITHITKLNDNLMKSLKTLDLESNLVGRDWPSILKLGEMKNLEVLYANNIELEAIEFNDVDDCLKTTSYFPSLKSLAINENKISNWSSINELNKLPKLEELRFRFNPLCNEKASEYYRQFVIARIARLKILNRTMIVDNIDSSDRHGAEYDYLRKLHDEWVNAGDGGAKQALFNAQNPRYEQLAKKFGFEKTIVKVKPDNLKSNLISLILQNEITGERITKRVPSSLNVQRLKVMIVNFFKSFSFKVQSMHLTYQNGKNPENEFELDNDYRTLGFYSVEDGDIIKVNNQAPHRIKWA